MPETTFTREQVVRLLNSAAELIGETLTLSEPCTDAVNLMVNAADALMGNPRATFDDVVESNYGDVGTDDDPRTWDHWA